MESWIPYQVVVAQNLHEGYSDTDLKNLQYLIENGRTLGIFVIILNNEDRWEQENTDGKQKTDRSRPYQKGSLTLPQLVFYKRHTVSPSFS